MGPDNISRATKNFGGLSENNFSTQTAIIQRNSYLSILHFHVPPRHLLTSQLLVSFSFSHFFLEFVGLRNLNFCPLRDACGYICKRGVLLKVIGYNFFFFQVHITPIYELVFQIPPTQPVSQLIDVHHDHVSASKYHHILHIMLHFHQHCVHPGKREGITVNLCQCLSNYRILLAYAIAMFILSTTHVDLPVLGLLQRFVFEGQSMPGVN